MKKNSDSEKSGHPPKVRTPMKKNSEEIPRQNGKVRTPMKKNSEEIPRQKYSGHPGLFEWLTR